jgi:cytochrome P450
VLGRRVHFLFHPTLVRAVLMEDEKGLFKEPRQLRVFQLGQGRNVLTTVGEGWKRQRQLLAPAFLPRQVARTLDLMRQAALDAHEALVPSGHAGVVRFDPAAYASRVTMDVMLRVLFSQPLPPDETAEVTASVRHLVTTGQQMLMWPLVPAAWMPFPGRAALMRHRDLLTRRVRRHIEARRARQGRSERQDGDLLDMMLEAEDRNQAASGDGRLSGREIEDNCLALFLAGHDTSAAALTWWSGYMALHPEHAQRARQEVTDVMGADWQARPLDPQAFARLHFLEATLKETMRLPWGRSTVMPLPMCVSMGSTSVAVTSCRGPSGSCTTMPAGFPTLSASSPSAFCPAHRTFRAVPTCPSGRGGTSASDNISRRWR